MSVLVIQNTPQLIFISKLCSFYIFFSQRRLGQLLWSSIFQRGPIRFSVLQFPIRLSLQASSPQAWIQLLPPQLVPVLQLVVLRHGGNWSVSTDSLSFLQICDSYVDIKCLVSRPQDWPQAMKEYVQRCFTACETEEDKDRTEKVLKEVLQDRLKDGSAYTIDWTHEPLPEWV